MRCWPLCCFTQIYPGVSGGFVGVDVFFVISGFLITGLLWREASTTGTVRLRRFYGARARRLLPASATVGVVTMVGAVVLLPVLQARRIVGDGIASALYVSNYRFILQGVNYLGAVTATIAVPALLVVGCRGAVLPGAAGLDNRHCMARAAWASPHSRPLRRYPQRPYLVVLALVAAISFALSLILTRVAASCGVLFAAHPGLAISRLVAWCPSPPASGIGSRHWLPQSPDGRGLALILLACNRVQPDHALSGYGRAVTHVGRGAADRCRLCHAVSRMRPLYWQCDRCAPSGGCRTPGTCGTGRCCW